MFERSQILMVLIGFLAVIVMGCGASGGSSTSPQDCSSAKIADTIGTCDRSQAQNFHVSSVIQMKWNPSQCEMTVQSYQHDNPNPVRHHGIVAYGDEITIGDPGTGETEIKIWMPGASQPSDSKWVWID